ATRRRFACGFFTKPTSFASVARASSTWCQDFMDAAEGGLTGRPATLLEAPTFASSVDLPSLPSAVGRPGADRRRHGPGDPVPENTDESPCPALGDRPGYPSRRRNA